MTTTKSYNKISTRLLSAVMSIVLVMAFLPVTSVAEDSDSLSTEVSFATMSGLSFVRDDYRDKYSDAFLLDAQANNLHYSQLDGLIDSSFDSIRDKVENDGLKYLLIDGNFTYNGEYYNNVAVAEKLKALEDETGVQIIVSTGSRDIYNVEASKFVDGKRKNETFTAPEQFKTIFYDYGFDIAASIYRSSNNNYGNLSYSVELDGGYRLIVIDASHYNINGIQYGSGSTEVDGEINDNLLTWIKNECETAAAKGQTVMGMCGWDFVGNEITSSNSTLKNAEQAADVLADAGMQYVFTSGSGRNDISTYVSDAGNVMYDVETGSITSFPNTYRITDFNSTKAAFSLVDVDDTKCVIGRDDTVYEQPYRETSSLGVQYADGDLAKYVSRIIENYLTSVLIPGVTANGTLDSFAKKQYGITLTDMINEAIGGGLNILNIIVIFDATNIMNLLEDMYGQATSTFLKEPKTLTEMCYKRLTTVFDAGISMVPCTKFITQYGFGDMKNGGTINDMLLSMIVYSYYGNEDSSGDAFVNDVKANLRTGELVSFVANLLGETLIRDLLFNDILSQIEFKPEYLIFLDDTADSLGSYLQTGFKYYIMLHGEDPTITGAIKSVLLDGFFKQYGTSIDEVIDYFVEQYYTGDKGENTGKQLATLIDGYVSDSDPKPQGDWNVSYDSTDAVGLVATKENYRIPSMITVTPGNNTQTEAYVTWYTKSTVENSNIELYDTENPSFIGKNFIGADGASITKTSDTIERTYNKLDLGFISLGETTVTLMKHVIKLSGLTAGKTYYLRVGDEKRNWWSDTIKLTTADGSDNVTFIHVADTTGNTDNELSFFKNIMSCSRYLYPDTDFILHTGNYVSNSSDINQWQIFLDGISSGLLNTLIVPTAGSDDSLDVINKNFTIGGLVNNPAISGAYYSFDYNNIHMAVLDSTYVKSDGTLDDAQLEWFKTDMDNSKAKWKFVSINSPVYTNGASASSDTFAKYRNQLSGLMDTYDVDVVFSGRDNVYYRTDALKANAVTNVPTVLYPHVEAANINYKTIVNPTGTVYSALGSSGANSQKTHDITSVSNSITGSNLNPTLPMFSAIEIYGNTLYITSYTLDGNKASSVDKVSIKKGGSLMGDTNDDGVVTASDARAVLRASAKLELLTNVQKTVCDMNSDGNITAADAREILRVSAGL